jgi:hypothetical protein
MGSVQSGLVHDGHKPAQTKVRPNLRFQVERRDLRSGSMHLIMSLLNDLGATGCRAGDLGQR